jgi:P27 family predicted phage terminase small subunit
MKSKIPKEPKHLKRAGRKLWRGILKDYEITESHDLKLLGEACGCVDRIVEARAEIEKEGAYFTDRWGQPKPHPAHGVEKDNKILLARLLRELSLDLEPPENRIPGRY